MNLTRRFQKEDRRLLATLSAIALGLCVDGAARLWPNAPQESALDMNSVAPSLEILRPAASDLEAVLAILEPKAPEAENAKELAADTSQAIMEDAQNGLLTELFIDRHRFRLQACFSRMGEAPFAALQRIDADGGGSTLERLEEYDVLGPYTVKLITHKSITLSAEDGRTIELTLFDPNPKTSAG